MFHLSRRITYPASDSPGIRPASPLPARPGFAVMSLAWWVLICSLPGIVSAELAESTRQQTPILGRDTAPVLPAEETWHGKTFALLTLEAERASGDAQEISPLSSELTDSVQTGESFPATTSAETSSAPEQAQELTSEEKERRKNYVSVGWIMLIGVALLGSILLLIVFYIGASIRRLARKPLPAAPLRDPFWYLRPEKSPETATVSARKDSTGDSSHDSDSSNQSGE